MVGDLEKFRTGKIPRLAVLISTFESCSAGMLVVTLPESTPVRYTEEDAGYVTGAAIVKQTLPGELLDMILSVRGRCHPPPANSPFGDGRLSFYRYSWADLTRTKRSCPALARFPDADPSRHSTQPNARWPFLNLQARLKHLLELIARSLKAGFSGQSFWNRLLKSLQD